MNMRTIRSERRSIPTTFGDTRKMFFTKRLLLLCVAVAAVLHLAKAQVLVFNWDRETNTGERVKESAEIDMSAQSMLMISDDCRLQHPSKSFHDFTATKKASNGKVAIKTGNICFVTDIPKSLEEVVEEARTRSEGQVPVSYNKPDKAYKTGQKYSMSLSELDAISPSLAVFCKDAAEIFELKPIRETAMLFWPLWWPWWPYCFWWPFPIWYDLNDRVLRA